MATEKLIDANKAKDFAELCFGDIFLQTCVKSFLEKCPAEDSVKVTRCRDCKAKYEYISTRWFCGLTGIPIDEDDFCSFGERRTET